MSAPRWVRGYDRETGHALYECENGCGRLTTALNCCGQCSGFAPDRKLAPEGDHSEGCDERFVKRQPNTAAFKGAKDAK